MKKIKSIINVFFNSICGFHNGNNALQLFAGALNTNVTTDSELSTTMKTMYQKELLKNSRTEQYHTQFGKKYSLPKGKGKVTEWRKWKTFSPSTTPLTEGVTPDGKKLKQEAITVTINQYGDYATVSDVLELTALDDVLLGASEEMGAAGGETADILTRNVLAAGTNVMFAPKNGAFETANIVTARGGLDATCILNSVVVNRVVTIMKKNKVPKINGKYICLIHPSVAMDLRNSDGWVDAHKYAAVTEIFNGEIGELHGCRFIECTNEKVWKGTNDSCPTGLSVYACIFLGADAYGVIDPEGAGMELIVKQKGSAGTADPLNQRSTVGYKFSHAAKILYAERVLRLECTSSFGSSDDSN